MDKMIAFWGWTLCAFLLGLGIGSCVIVDFKVRVVERKEEKSDDSSK